MVCVCEKKFDFNTALIYLQFVLIQIVEEVQAILNIGIKLSLMALIFSCLLFLMVNRCLSQTSSSLLPKLVISPSTNVVFDNMTSHIFTTPKHSHFSTFHSHIFLTTTFIAATSTVFASPKSITDVNKQPDYVANLLKFEITGKIFNQTEYTLKVKFKEVFGPQLHAANIIHYNSTTGSFSTVLFINASLVSRDVDERAIFNNVEGYKYFSMVDVKERCYTATCGDMRNRCVETMNTVYCSCHIGFVGARCGTLNVVDGTSYGTWSNWTTCHLCKQKRFRYCYPDPMHGGKCIIGPNPNIEIRWCFQDCKRNDSDEDREIVGYVVFGLLIVILLLLIGFICTYKGPTKPSDQKKISVRSKSTLRQDLDAYRIPSVLVNRPVVSRRSEFSRPKESNVPITPEYAIPMKHLPPDRDGVDNMGYHEQDNSEDLYKQQLEMFLNEAPGLTRNSVVTDWNDDKDDNVSDNYVTIHSPSASFSPALKKQEEIKDKIFQGAPTNLDLVIT